MEGNPVGQKKEKKEISRPLLALIVASGITFFLLIFAVLEVGISSVGGMKGLYTLSEWLDGKTLPVDIGSMRPEKSEKTLKAGEDVYRLRCSVCHGLKGDGKGAKADLLEIKPTNFSAGMFKFRSTKGLMPADIDIFKTVSRGLHGTAMLPWPALTSDEKWQVVYYVMTFSDLFADAGEPEFVKVPEPASSPPQYVSKGKSVYEKAKCWECHGHDLKGDGEKADKLKDDWQRPIRPANLTEQMAKRGASIEDLYLTIATGLNGTPMRSYAETLTGDEMLALAYYVQSRSPKPSGKSIVKGLRGMPKEVKTGLTIDHILMPTMYRAKYLKWIFDDSHLEQKQ